MEIGHKFNISKNQICGIFEAEPEYDGSLRSLPRSGEGVDGGCISHPPRRHRGKQSRQVLKHRKLEIPRTSMKRAFLVFVFILVFLFASTFLCFVFSFFCLCWSFCSYCFFSSWLCWPGFHQFRFTSIIQNTEIIHKLHDARAEEEGKKKKKKKKTSDDKNDDHGSDYEDGDDRKYGENADGTDDILIYGPSRMFQHNMSHNQNRTILWLSVNDSHPHCDDRSPFRFLLILEPERYFTSRLCTSASSVVATENAARRRM